jgi:hypothetical protein
MTRSNLERYAPLTGIVFVVLIVIAAIIGGETPDSGDSTLSVVRWWQDNDTSQIWANAIAGWSTIFLVWFGGSLRVALLRTEGEPGRLSLVSFGGALLIAAGLLSFAGFGFAAADVADDVPDVAPAVIQTLSILSTDFFLLVAGGTGLFMIATGVAVVRFGALPTWMGYVAVIVGIAAVTPAGFFAFLVTGIWILIASVLLYRRGQPGPTPSAAT